MPKLQITTLTLMKYDSVWGKFWAFCMMLFAHLFLFKENGQTFYKLLGSGRGLGFSPWPDWSRYAVLQVWESEEAAKDFLKNSLLIKSYKRQSKETYTVFLKSIKAHGKWSGKAPFITSEELDTLNPYVAVITRAMIRPSKLRRFWAYVPESQKPIKAASGLIYTKGIGEVPFLQMATFSIWNSVEDLNDFAYKSREHKEAIKLTKELDWYSEELFARFQPYKTEGTWEGRDLLNFS
ncbi:MAG: heme-degrading monooxygenase HmoA [Arcticibacterium sp.]|jgi:heme-degrading monooxygenase HmoA